MHILFRTAGGRAKNRELGMGHVYRCLNLAKNLKNHKKYFLIEDYGGIKDIFENYTVKKLEPDIELEIDIKKTLDFIKFTKNSIVFN